MLIRHPTIYLDHTGASTHALLVREGRIAAVGDDAIHGAESTDEVIRPDATCLFPALGDAHVHLWGLGLRAGTVDLRGLGADEALDRLADAVPQTEGWVFGINLDEHNFEDGRRITRRDLDELFPDHPVCIHRVDRHAMWVNSAALERADFRQNWEFSDGGRIERDEHGEPTGYLVDAAMEPIADAIPAPGLAEDRRVFFESARKFRNFGVAFCTVARSSTTHLSMLSELADSDQLPLAIDVLIDGMDDGLDEWVERGPRIGDDLRVAGIKFYADGALGSAGAHLLSEYKSGGKGVKIHPEGFLRRRIPELMDSGWQIAVHAIGDAACREVLDAFEATDADDRRRLRPRVEHAQMVAPKDCPRFAELDVIASIQPIHLRSDAPWAPQMLDGEQLDRLFPWRRLLPAPLAGGSDYPIDDPNPWHGIATAMTRRGADGEPFRPDQALDRREALSLYTAGAAYASHRESDLGALHPGFRAACIALDTDPFQAAPDDIRATEASILID